MESVSANEIALAAAPLEAAAGDGHMVAADGAASGPLSFAVMLQALVSARSMPAANPTDGQLAGQGGQMLTGTGGNSWPVLPSLAGSQDSLLADTAAGKSTVTAQDGKQANFAAAKLISAASGFLSAAKPLLEGGGLSQATLTLEALHSAQERGGDPLLVPAPEQAKFSPARIEPAAADVARENLLSAAALRTTSPDTQMVSDGQRFMLTPRFDASHWQDAFASRVVWMAKEQHQFVELRLNPPELGLINVRMALHHNDANVAIGVQNSGVREAIEASLPRLRELLAESGVSLANIDVSTSHGSSHGGRDWAGSHDASPFALADVSSDAFEQMEMAQGLFPSYSKGLVDHYA